MSARSIFTNSGVPNYTFKPDPTFASNFMQPLVYGSGGELIFSSSVRAGKSTTGLALEFTEVGGTGACASGVLNIATLQLSDGRQQVTLEFAGASSTAAATGTATAYKAAIPTGWNPDPGMDIVVGYGKMDQGGIVYPSIVSCMSGDILLTSAYAMGLVATDIGAFMCTYILAG
tara:strand:- start:7220 stop:7741 length:522 start_codon:yes stop_codon:yes gene_type:complete